MGLNPSAIFYFKDNGRYYLLNGEKMWITFTNRRCAVCFGKSEKKVNSCLFGLRKKEW